MIRTAVLATVLALLAASAQAQSLPGASWITGSLDGGVTDAVDGSAFARTDFTIRLPVPRSETFALELGLFSFFREGRNPHETYAALAWDDRLRIGVVRPAYDSVLPSPFAHVAPHIEDITLESDTAYTTETALRRTTVPVGVSWTTSGTPLRWGLSLHDAAKGNFRAITGAAGHISGDWTVAVAAEGVWRRDSGDWLGLNAKLGLRYDGARLGAGLILLHPEANERDDALEMDLRVPLASGAVISALAHLEQNPDLRHYGLSAALPVSRADTLMLTATGGSLQTLYAGLTHRF